MKKLIAILLLAISLAAQTRPSAPLPSQETVEGFLQRTFGYDPTIKWQITKIEMAPEGLPQVWVLLTTPQGQSQTTRLYVTPDGQHAIQGEMIPFGADPFLPARQQLKNATGPARGPAEAPLTIVEFSDLQCPHCKAAQPIIDKLLADNPNARFVFQNFPLQSHDWALKAASYGDCIARQSNDAFFKFAAGVYAAQESINLQNADEKLGALATQSGADAAKAATCAVAPDTKSRVEASVKLGEQVGVTGTPTVFLNGRKIGSVSGIPYELLDKIAKFQATQK